MASSMRLSSVFMYCAAFCAACATEGLLQSLSQRLLQCRFLALFYLPLCPCVYLGQPRVLPLHHVRLYVAHWQVGKSGDRSCVIPAYIIDLFLLVPPLLRGCPGEVSLMCDPLQRFRVLPHVTLCPMSSVGLSYDSACERICTYMLRRKSPYAMQY